MKIYVVFESITYIAIYIIELLIVLVIINDFLH